MVIQPPDYDKVEQQLWKENGDEVRDLLENQDSGLLRRIRTFSDRFGFDKTEVCEKIKNDFMFACCFAKNATRTGFHEREAEKYLRMFPDLIRSFRPLPSRGTGANYIDQMGNIVTGKKPSQIKSLDFMWIAGNTHIRCFAAHKFTRESGGSQDHQRNELIRLLQAFESCKDKNTAFFAICDGPYYDARNLSILREHVRNDPPYSFACPIGQVPNNVEKLIKNQRK